MTRIIQFTRNKVVRSFPLEGYDVAAAQDLQKKGLDGAFIPYGLVLGEEESTTQELDTLQGFVETVFDWPHKIYSRNSFKDWCALSHLREREALYEIEQGAVRLSAMEHFSMAKLKLHANLSGSVALLGKGTYDLGDRLAVDLEENGYRVLNDAVQVFKQT